MGALAAALLVFPGLAIAAQLDVGGDSEQSSDHRVKVEVSCDEACTVDATGTIKVPRFNKKGWRKFNLRGADEKQLVAGETAGLKLAFKPKTERAVRKAFEEKEKSTAKVIARVVDAAGNETIADSFEITVRKSTAPANGSFAPSQGSPEAAGNAPHDLEVDDLDGDGDQDVAVLNTASADISLLLNDGSGDFSGGPPVPAVNTPTSVATTENDDPVRDCTRCIQISTVSSEGAVQVTEGNYLTPDSGTFEGFPLQLVPPGVLGRGPGSISVGDFNDDGQQDLAIAFEATANVAVLLWDRDVGEFAPAATAPTGRKPGDVAVGDLNGDGAPDLVTANAGSDDLTVLLGDGTGGLREPASSPESLKSAPSDVAVGDFDDDGTPDVAIASTESDDVSILLGGGGGGLAAAGSETEPVGAQPRSLAVGDLAGDAHLDLVTANAGSDDVTILVGGDGADFREADGSPVAVGSTPRAVATGPLDDGGRGDIVTANAMTDDVSVLLHR